MFPNEPAETDLVSPGRGKYQCYQTKKQQAVQMFGDTRAHLDYCSAWPGKHAQEKGFWPAVAAEQGCEAK